MSEAVSFVLGTQSTLHILDYPDEGGPLSMAHAFQRICTLHVWFCRGLLCMAKVLFSRNLFSKHMHEPQASRTNALWHITFAEICKFIEICLDALGMSVIAYIDVESREVKLSHALTRDICKLACHITATIPSNLIKLIKINK